jgi:hypothetical protein
LGHPIQHVLGLIELVGLSGSGGWRPFVATSGDEHEPDKKNEFDHCERSEAIPLVVPGLPRRFAPSQ